MIIESGKHYCVTVYICCVCFMFLSQLCVLIRFTYCSELLKIYLGTYFFAQVQYYTAGVSEPQISVQVYIRVGSPGRCHDASVYADSELKNLVEGAHFKTHQAIIEGTRVAPIILCDQAFPLAQNLMKPYANPQDGTPQKVFNYNLSRTRRIVENAFGRMKARFQFVAKRTECRLPNSRRAIRASCILHNTCEEFRDNVEQPWEQEAQQLAALCVQPFHNTQAHTEVVEETRTAFAKYFSKRAPHSSGASSEL